MPNININNLNLYYEVVGEGKPLVMVHGNGEDHKIFDKAVSLLKDRGLLIDNDDDAVRLLSNVNYYHLEGY